MSLDNQVQTAAAAAPQVSELTNNYLEQVQLTEEEQALVEKYAREINLDDSTTIM